MKYDYQVFFEEKLREVAKEPRVVDIGGGEPFQKDLARYREIFQHVRFETVDPDAASHPTHVGSIYQLPFRDNELPAILCKSVFEHLAEPHRAAEELYRVLQPGGKLLLYTHFIYPYHARVGVYGDYFRYTEEGLRFLFRRFSQVVVRKQGGIFRAFINFIPGLRYIRPLAEPLAYALDRILGEQRTTTPGFYIFAVK